MGEQRLSLETIAECKKQLSLREENLKILSAKTGLAYGYVRLIMSGKRCSLTAKNKICNYLGVDQKDTKVG